MKSKLLLSLIVLILLSACKKKNEEVAISLKGKWTVENFAYKYYDNNVLNSTYTDAVSGTTFDFQNNGSLVITDPSGTETYPYNITSDSKVEFDGTIYEIKNLTANSVTLYIREDYAPGEYEEVSLNLKR